MHTVFRITEIKTNENNDNLQVVKLKITSDNDFLLNALAVRIRKSLKALQNGTDYTNYLFD